MLVHFITFFDCLHSCKTNIFLSRKERGRGSVSYETLSHKLKCLFFWTAVLVRNKPEKSHETPIEVSCE